MLQQPVPELRSFQSLSKYAGGSRSVLGRRTSSVLAIRRSSQCKKRLDELETIGPVSDSKETVSEVGKQGPSNETSTLRWDKQVEWKEEEENVDELDDLPYPGFAEPALHCLKQTRPPRSWALTLVMSPWFDRVTMLVILINCITLGMYRPCDDGPDCSTYRCNILALIDHAIFAYFFAEMVRFRMFHSIFILSHTIFFIIYRSGHKNCCTRFYWASGLHVRHLESARFLHCGGRDRRGSTARVSWW